MLSSKQIPRLSFSRILGLIRKEFILIFRDRGTIAMLIIMPLMLLFVFGFAIDLDPKHLPTMVVNYDPSPLTRTFISDMNASGYFHFLEISTDKTKAKRALRTGEVGFVLTIPANFTHRFIRGENPQLLVEVDGADPGSSASALHNIAPILNASLERFSQRGLRQAAGVAEKREVNLTIQRLYNESNRSAFDIVPGLIGVLLTLTLVMLTSTAITSEFESGTMEILLSTPLKPIEIILGKVIPYVVLGYLQLTSILIFGKILIHVPFEGSVLLLYLAVAPFIIANLMVGMTFSTLASTPMQAMQLSMFFQLPSILLTGYLFSFHGMPKWAQVIGACLPMTYFLRIVRGIMLKGNEMMQILPNMMPIIFITLVLMGVTRLVFRKTLD